MSRFCTSCGAPVGAQALHCTNCGAALPPSTPTAEVAVPPPPTAQIPVVPPAAAPPAAPPPVAPPPAASGDGSDGSGRNNTVLIVVIAVLATLVIVGIIALVATRGGNDDPATITSAPTTSMVTTTSTTSTTLARTPPASTTTTAATPTTTTTPPTAPPTGPGDVTEQPAGLFCRDLKAKGYSYSAAVDYWRFNGQPDRMDADKNGIPCETVYPRSDVIAYWGDNASDTYDGVPAGLFCKDLAARGFTYPEAVAYWFATGAPDRMDADKNGIPCETVYSPAEVQAYWG